MVCKTITVQPKPKPNIYIPSDGLSVSQSPTVGETVEVACALYNDGNAKGDATVVLTVDGQKVDSKTVSVPAKQNAGVQFTFTPSSSGDLKVCCKLA